MRARGFSLVETLIATGLFLMALVPALTLLTTSTAEVVKARDRGIAVQLASSMAEWLRSQRPAARRDVAAVRATDLAYLRPVLEAYRAAQPAEAQAVDRLLSNFRCEARVAGARARVVVSWSEAGVAQRYELETRLEAE